MSASSSSDNTGTQNRDQHSAKHDDAVSVLVHQLRSSLASVRLAHQALLDDKEGTLTQKQRHLLKQAQHRTNRMLYLTDDLLAPESDARSVFSVHLRLGSIEELIDETLEEFSARFADKRLEVTRQYGERPQLVPFDYEKLLDAIRNLIDNAIKYTPTEGQIKIVTVYEHDVVRITIKDTGIGVSDDDVEKLFQKFTRMENARFIDQTGLGLGLYIVRRIIEEHGGTLQYTPNEPKGSQFIITLPLSM